MVEYSEGKLRSILREGGGVYKGKVEEYIEGKWRSTYIERRVRSINREGGGVY